MTSGGSVFHNESFMLEEKSLHRRNMNAENAEMSLAQMQQKRKPTLEMACSDITAIV